MCIELWCVLSLHRPTKALKILYPTCINEIDLNFMYITKNRNRNFVIIQTHYDKLLAQIHNITKSTDRVLHTFSRYTYAPQKWTDGHKCSVPVKGATGLYTGIMMMMKMERKEDQIICKSRLPTNPTQVGYKINYHLKVVPLRIH